MKFSQKENLKILSNAPLSMLKRNVSVLHSNLIQFPRFRPMESSGNIQKIWKSEQKHKH